MILLQATEILDAADQVAGKVGGSNGVVYILTLGATLLAAVATYFYRQQAQALESQIKELKDDRKTQVAALKDDRIEQVKAIKTERDSLQAKYDRLIEQYQKLGETAIQNQTQTSHVLEKAMGSIQNIPSDVLNEMKDFYNQIAKDTRDALKEIEARASSKLEQVERLAKK